MSVRARRARVRARDGRVDVRLVGALASCVLASSVAGQEPVPSASTEAAVATASEARPKGPPEPAVRRTVAEDDAVRIEELRVRGEVKSIVVHNKLGGGSTYEIVPASGARDPSQPGGNDGQRVWNLFSF